MTQAVSRRPLTAEARVRFVVYKVALGQVFLRVLRLSPVSVICCVRVMRNYFV
jgi:hypothetical protein